MFVLSGGVHSAYTEEDLDLKDNYSLTNAANICGFHSDLALDALSKQYPKIRFIHSSPGFVATNWGKEMPTVIKGMVRFFQYFATSPEVWFDFCQLMWFVVIFQKDCAENLTFMLPGDPGFYICNHKKQFLEKLPEHTSDAVDKVYSFTDSVLKSIQ